MLLVAVELELLGQGQVLPLPDGVVLPGASLFLVTDGVLPRLVDLAEESRGLEEKGEAQD